MANTFLFSKPARLKFYQDLKWKKGISQLSRETRLSRQMLNTARKQVEFHRLFNGKTELTYRFAKAAMNGYGNIKPTDFRRWCKALDIAVTK